MNKCIMCGKEFEAKRADAKFCSGACKMKFSRAGGKMGMPTQEEIKKIDTIVVHTIVVHTDSSNLGPDGYLNDIEAHKVFLKMEDAQRARVIFLMGCCKIGKGEAIAQVIENDIEDAEKANKEALSA